MTPAVVAIIMFSLLLILVGLKVPVSFALSFAVIPILILTPRVTPILLLQRMMNQFNSFILLAIPFFLLAALIMNESGITDKLIRFAKSLVGPLPGGMGHVNVLVSMLFAGVSGSSNADAAGIGSVLIPAMEREGYDKKFTVAVTACSSVMGVIIPPSITMIIWGGIMGTSVSALFLAGVVPGVMIAVAQMLLVVWYAKRRNYPRSNQFNGREILNSGLDALLPMLTPAIIIGGVVFGWFTPTEASLIAVVYSMILGFFVYRTLTLKSFTKLLTQTGQLTAVVLFAVGSAAIYAWVLSFYRIPNFLLQLFSGVTGSSSMTLLLVVGIFLVVGTFMDAVPAIVILGPLLAPVVTAAGIHPLHYGIVGVVSLAFGLVTPPYGLCLLIASDIAGINAMKTLKEVGVFLLAMVMVLLLLVFIPELSLGIPQILFPEAFR